MVYNWNTAFENYPAGSLYGSTMGEALRRYKKASKERMEVEHEFDEEATNPPVCGHKAGYCTVVEIKEGYAGNNIDGALGYDTEESALYRDNGSSVEQISGFAHNDLLGLDDDDHTQYLKTSGGTVSDDLEVDLISGLPTVQAEPDNGEILSKGAHLAETLHHDDGVITDSDISCLIPLNKFSCFTYTTDTVEMGDTLTRRYYIKTAGTIITFPVIYNASSLSAGNTVNFRIANTTTDDGESEFGCSFTLDGDGNPGDLSIAYYVLA